MTDAVARGEELARETPNSVMLDHFKHPGNPAIHRHTTAQEIWRDKQSKIDIFVSAVGTDGTINGVGEVLNPARPQTRIVAGEPAGAVPGQLT